MDRFCIFLVVVAPFFLLKCTTNRIRVVVVNLQVFS